MQNLQYTDQDRTRAAAIRAWLDSPDGHRKLSVLARDAGVTDSTARELIDGTAKHSPSGKLGALYQAMLAQTDADDAIAGTRIPFAQTSVYRLIEAVCNRAREYAWEDDIGVLFGRVGVGKTRGLREYCARTKGALYLRAFAGMNNSVLLNRLVDLVGATVRQQSGSRWSRGTNQEKLDAIVRRLSGTDRMLIIDETTRMAPSCIETMRDIADDAQVGLVLAGRETLEPMIQDEEGRFGEVASRVGYWPPVITGITETDTKLLVCAFWQATEIDEETHQMYWQTSAGSARALSKLMASTKKYCTRKKTSPTPKIVSEIWRNTMRPTRTRILK